MQKLPWVMHATAPPKDQGTNEQVDPALSQKGGGPITALGRRLYDSCPTVKSTAVLANTARGVWAAGLEVFEDEPIPTDDPLLQLDNVVVLPHISSASYATRGHGPDGREAACGSAR